MNAAHLHLMFNHLPIVGLGFAFLINLWAMIRKSVELKNLSFWFYILVGILSVLPILTGDGAGEILETYPGISKDAIENHRITNLAAGIYIVRLKTNNGDMLTKKVLIQ